MTRARLKQLLDGFTRARVAVLGDFFVDHYLVIEPTLAEVSLETGLSAHQVVEVRCQPGAAGTVTNNLAALRVGRILALGVRGDDGLGYELRRGLAAGGVDTTHLHQLAGRFTPTYTKPLVREPGGLRELNRLDLKNRAVTPPEAEEQVLASLSALAGEIDALIVLDQVQEEDCGVVTRRVREAVAALARSRPDLPVLADSRVRIDRFREVSLKCNVHEAAGLSGEAEDQPLHHLARAVSGRQGRPCYVTLGAGGVLVADGREVVHLPAVPVSGQIDIVGAGDSFSASSAAALAAGASPVEAAQVGCLVASLTIQQLGTTGTASPAQVLARLGESGYGEG